MTERLREAERIAIERIAGVGDLWTESATATRTDDDGNVWVTVVVRVDAADFRAEGGAL